MPVSSTANRIAGTPSRSPSGMTRITTSPWLVALTAWPTRLPRICRVRPGSPMTWRGNSGRQSTRRMSPRSLARGVRTLAVSSIIALRSNGIGSTTSRLAETRARSSTSLRIVARLSPAVLTLLTYWRCLGVRSSSSRRPDIPMTALSGALISWLMARRYSLIPGRSVGAGVLGIRVSSRSVSVMVVSWSLRPRSGPPSVRPARAGPAPIHCESPSLRSTRPVRPLRPPRRIGPPAVPRRSVRTCL